MLIGLVFQHGRFTASDTEHTAIALMGYAVGLYAYSGVKVAAPAFYALDKSKVPIIASFSAVATNLVLNVLAHRFLTSRGYGYLGMAIGTSLGAIVNLVVLTTAFRRLTRDVDGPKGLFLQLFKVILASLLMGAAVWGVLHVLGSLFSGRSTSSNLILVSAGIAVGALVYAGLCRLLRVGEMDDVLAALRRRRVQSRA
jgi:putative peptidoglycan lipid II flippase